MTIASAMALALAALLTAACSASARDSESEDAAVEVSTEQAAHPLITADPELAAGDLTKEQSAIVLKLLDDICGDTWCEGEYNWHFPKIDCRFAKGKCTLGFRVTDRNPTPPKNYRRSCTVRDARAFTDLVQTAPNGYRSLDETFYDNVSRCVQRIEDDLKPK
ncbi:hypothetical protein [Pendulispora albinea]|uniref:Secreted protein n=1 Tax=Pendulispora albinea TaxID=2741071 RepID=A0ABZ2LP41_9BACT